MKMLYIHDKLKKMNREANDGIITNISSSSSSEDGSSIECKNKDWTLDQDDESDDFEQFDDNTLGSKKLNLGKRDFR